MEITNHDRELALTMGWANMHVCVFCWNLLKDFMLKLMCSAVMLCAEINVFAVLKLMCFAVMLCAEINVFVVLKLMCPAVMLCAEINVCCCDVVVLKLMCSAGTY